MKNLILLILVCSSVLTLFGQQETIVLDEFWGLDASTGVSIVIYKGEPRAEVTIVKGEREDLIVTSKNGIAVIKFKSQNWGWNGGSRNAKIKLYTDDLSALKSIEASAGASIYSDEIFTPRKFQCEVSSGASLSLEVESGSTDVEVSSGGSIAMEGAADKLIIEVSSGGSFSGRKLKANKVMAEASSGGSAKVWVKEELEAEASSGGSIKYKGEPRYVNLDASKYSGGSIKKI